MDNNISKSILRSSGFCVIAGSILLSMGYWTRPYSEKQFVQDFAGDMALYSSVLVAIGILAILTGLPALFYSQMQGKNSPRFIAVAFTFTGLAAFHLGTLALYFVLPVLVNHSNGTYDLIAQDVPPFPRFAIFWAISLLIQVVGLIMYGFKMLKTTQYSRVATFALLAGALMLIVSPPINFRLLQPAVTLVMTGFAWYGLTLVKSSTAIPVNSNAN
jgi:hypothetical protein